MAPLEQEIPLPVGAVADTCSARLDASFAGACLDAIHDSVILQSNSRLNGIARAQLEFKQLIYKTCGWLAKVLESSARFARIGPLMARHRVLCSK